MPRQSPQQIGQFTYYAGANSWFFDVKNVRRFTFSLFCKPAATIAATSLRRSVQVFMLPAPGIRLSRTSGRQKKSMECATGDT